MKKLNRFIGLIIYLSIGLNVLAQNTPSWMNYLPDTAQLGWFPIKTIRLNLHFVCKTDGSGNFNDSLGRIFAKDLVGAANASLAENHAMNLPKGNRTPILPIQLRYELYSSDSQSDGIYFIYSDSMYTFNRSDFRTVVDPVVFEKYGKDTDRALNIFLFENTDGSGKTGGIVDRSWAKVGGLYYHYQTYQRWAWFGAGLLNHEIGHSLGLVHTWSGDDGCDDTPINPNCWNVTPSGVCQNPSNNVMDYNANQNAYTPCQIGRIHAALSTDTALMKFLKPINAVVDSMSIYIKPNDTVYINGNRCIEGNLILGRKSVLILHQSKLTLPPGGKIIRRRKSQIIEK